MRTGPRGISRGQRLACSLCGCVPSSRPNNSAGPNRSRGIFPPKPVAGSAEKVAAWSLASIGHRNLTPGLLRQLIAALRHGAPLPAHQPGFAGRPPSLVCRTGPSRLRRPHRKARRNVQDVPRPQGRQSLPEGRRHSEGVVPGDPPGPEVAQFQGPFQHIQRQLGLRPVALPLLRNLRRLTPVSRSSSPADTAVCPPALVPTG